MWRCRTPGIPDSEFIQSDRVLGPTKEEVRVVTVSKARLSEGDYVIDVGCGTGSLTVEAALQVTRTGRVFAIDDNEEAVGLTRKNVEKFQLQDRVEVILGNAPEAMAALPKVNTVIVGGSKELGKIINVAYQRLKVEGRVVVNAILLETAVRALDELNQVGFNDVDVVQVFVAKGRVVPSGTMMLARNPITVISATKNAE